MDPIVLGLAFMLMLYLLSGLRQINQWEVALRFTLGKYSGRISPGLTIFLPVFQQLRRIDTRTRNRDLLRQMVITRGFAYQTWAAWQPRPPAW